MRSTRDREVSKWRVGDCRGRRGKAPKGAGEPRSVSRETLPRPTGFHVKQPLREWRRFQDLLRAYGPALDLTGPGLDLDQQWDIAGAIADFVPTGARVADLGAGAGLPGIPLALRRRDAEVVLVERRERRATFLRRVVGELGLGNIQVFAGSADRFRGPPVQVVIAQKVGTMGKVWRAARRLVADSGRLVTIRGAGFEPEVEELKRQGVEARVAGQRRVGDALVIAVDWRRE